MMRELADSSFNGEAEAVAAVLEWGWWAEALCCIETPGSAPQFLLPEKCPI